MPEKAPKIKKIIKNNKGESRRPKPVPDKPRFIQTEVFSKPAQQSSLFQGFREVEIDAEILRLRMQSESVENGRGKGIVRNFTFRRFKDQPRGIFFISIPRGVSGGSFEPTERLLEPGEKVQVSYTMMV